MAPMSFSDFPDDIQLNILSFLGPIEISRFACTCRRFAVLCSHSSPSSVLWLAICDRRWGSKTQLRRWSSTPSPRLYNTLDNWEHLIGFWNPVGPIESLVFFEWSPSCIIGSRISPSPIAASYSVRKIPFLWLGLSAAGETLSYLHTDNPLSDSDIIPVTIRLTGSIHFAVEYDMGDCHDSEELHGLEAGSRPDRVLSEIYQYFANRTSPGAEKFLRRQRKKKEKERLGRAVHFLRIADYSRTPTRPLQGLWKGISENMNLQFYAVKQDNDGEITCWLIDDPAEILPGYSPVSHVFRTLNTILLESPFPIEEHAIYSMRKHIGSAGSFHCNMDWEIVSRIFCIKDEPVVPEHMNTSGDPIDDKGRIWEYEDGTFGFGFLRNDFIIDMKHIALDGYILDVVESSH